MTETSLILITDFFERYRQFAGDIAGNEWSSFETNFERLKLAFSQFQQEVIEEDLRNAPGYNIFSILKLERNEVRTHSAFLANLLNPSASHGQRHLFLQEFLNHCSSRFPGFPSLSGQIDDGFWNVSVERHTLHGNLDIVVSNPYHHYIMVIENKVDAYEQPEQLWRYSQWLAAQEDEYPLQALIFLTTTGYTGFTAGGASCYSISYRQDISTWLNIVLPNIQAEPVKQVVKQYLYLIRTF